MGFRGARVLVLESCSAGGASRIVFQGNWLDSDWLRDSSGNNLSLQCRSFLADMYWKREKYTIFTDIILYYLQANDHFTVFLSRARLRQHRTPATVRLIQIRLDR